MTAENAATLFDAPYFRIPWPTPSIGGETVTLRVRITLAQSQEPSLWVARRCLLHRAAGKDTDVSLGVGVHTEVKEDRDIFRMRGAPPVGGAGVLLRVQFVRKEDAERAVAADPENVSIVEGTLTHGAFRMPRKVHDDEEPIAKKNRISISGLFTVGELCEIANLVPSFGPVCDELDGELFRIGAKDEAVIGVEVEENRIVAVQVKAKGGL
jgi:hypothetical protein